MVRTMSDLGKKQGTQALAKGGFTDLKPIQCRNCLDKLGQLKALSHFSQGTFAHVQRRHTSPRGPEILRFAWPAAFRNRHGSAPAENSASAASI